MYKLIADVTTADILTRCELLGTGYGSNARMAAEHDLIAEAELAWARAIVADADES